MPCCLPDQGHRAWRANRQITDAIEAVFRLISSTIKTYMHREGEPSLQKEKATEGLLGLVSTRRPSKPGSRPTMSWCVMKAFVECTSLSAKGSSRFLSG